jgi:hypothetical protein
MLHPISAEDTALDHNVGGLLAFERDKGKCEAAFLIPL